MTALALVAGLTSCASGGAGPGVAANRPATHPSVLAPAAEPAERHRQYLACLDAEGVPLAERGAARNAPPEADDGGRLAAAKETCRRYAPSAGEPGQLSGAGIERMREYAACLRAHGLSGYPDPDPISGQPPLTGELGERLKNDPRRPAAEQACRSVLPAGPGGDVNEAAAG
ncbi:hypothetical protein WEI85_10470 [Actinomycetes bacterium KLBMP 9797]